MTVQKITNRRMVLKSAGALATVGLAAPYLGNRAFAAEQITVADVGGAPGAAIKQAFYDPFEKDMGIKVVGIAHDPDPVTQFKLLVDTKSFIWDACMVTPDHVLRLTQEKNYLDPLKISAEESKDILPGMLTDNWLGFSVFGIAMAYRTDKLGEKGPKSWADFWNVEAFPGRRGLYKDPWGLLEVALLADGVKPSELYPIDVDRAFASLEKIRDHVSVWWTSGAQNTQILQSGEVDMADTWSARAHAAASAGVPIQMVWEGAYSVDGWSIPAGTPKAELARTFIKYCMRPERQAAYSSIVANGPTNRHAFDLLPPERTKILPTADGNFGGLVAMDAAWWGANYDAVAERFQEFLLL